MSIVIWKMADLFWTDRTLLDFHGDIETEWTNIFSECFLELKRLDPTNENLSSTKSKSKKVMFWFDKFYKTGYLYCPEDNISYLKDESERAKMWVLLYMWQFVSPNEVMMDIKFFQSMLQKKWNDELYQPLYYIRYGCLIKFKVEDKGAVNFEHIVINENWINAQDQRCMVNWIPWCAGIQMFRNADDRRINLCTP